MTAVEIVGLRARVRDRVHRYHDVHDLTGLLRRSLPELREISCVEGPVDGLDPAEQIFLRSWGLPHLTRLACRDVALLRYLSCPELLCPMASQHVCLPLVADVLQILLEAVQALSSGERRGFASAVQALLDVCHEKIYARIDDCLPTRPGPVVVAWDPWPPVFAAQVEGDEMLSDDRSGGAAELSAGGLPRFLEASVLSLVELRHLLGSAESLTCRLALRLRSRPDWALVLAQGLSPSAWRSVGHRLCEAGRQSLHPVDQEGDIQTGWVPLRIAHQRLRGTPGIGALQTVRRLLPAWQAQGWARKTSERRNAVYEVDVRAVRDAYLDGYRTASWDTYRRHPKGWAYDARHDPPIPVRRRSRRR